MHLSHPLQDCCHSNLQRSSYPPSFIPMATTTAAASTKGRRPLVILAGWLGSHPKALRRYEDLYRTLGCDVLTRIAPPYAVVQSVLSEVDDPVAAAAEQLRRTHRRAVSPVSSLPSSLSLPPSLNHHPYSIRDLAWEILHQVHRRECPPFYVHAFSNGGCFVWESIRHILQSPAGGTRQNWSSSKRSNKKDDNLHCERQRTESSSSSSSPPLNLAWLQRLRQSLAGVVFDSCPIAELDRLGDALEHCSWMERAQVVRYVGLDCIMRRSVDDTTVQDRIRRRIDSYVAGLREDITTTTSCTAVPQLYLYGRDDPLAPALFIDTLVEDRRKMLGRDRVFRRTWDTSRHCGHLKMHPEEYTMAVASFLEATFAHSSSPRSKL